MSRIDELIAELCPDGVEFKALGEVSEIKRGTSITKSSVMEGTVPVVAGGQTPAYFHNTHNRSGQTIVIAGSGSAGFVSWWDQPIFVSDAFSVKASDKLSAKYCYYWLESIQQQIYDLKSGGGVLHVYPRDVARLRIPIPPLEIQREIVKVLDTFTQLEAELKAELEARQQQYEYYQDCLLCFEKLPFYHGEPGRRTGKSRINDLLTELCPEGVEFKSLQELFVTKNGYTPSTTNKAYWTGGTVPWFRMEDIRKNGRILGKSMQQITEEAVKGGNLFPANSIIISTLATIGEHALITVPHLSNQQLTSLSLKPEYSERLDIKFIFYCCFVLDEWCRNNTNSASFASVDMNGFKKFRFPIPPLEVQREIVAILDKFDALVNDLSSGLPAEIQARRQQYQYYRDRLLSFKEAT